MTTTGAHMEGATANSTFGTSGDATFTHRYGVAGGKRLGDDGHVRLNASLGRDYRSDRTYTGSNGVALDLSGRSDIDTVLLSGGVKFKGLAFDAVWDSYHVEDWTGYGEPYEAESSWNFDLFATSLAYSWKVTDWLTLVPKAIYDVQKPWVGTGPGWVGSGQQTYDVRTQRATGNLTANAQIRDFSRALLGVEVYDDRAKAIRTLGEELQFEEGTSDSIDYQSVAAYAQYELDTDIANLTVGARFQNHSYAGNALVPRAAVTNAWHAFHAKAVYGQSFRTPQIELINYDAGRSVTPERATAYELELGYQFIESLSLVSNAFYQQINDILVFGGVQVDGMGAEAEAYFNSKKHSNYGVESQLRARDRWGNI